MLCSAGLVAASDFCDFAGDEFLCGRSVEVAVVGGVFVSTEGAMDGFFPGECVRP